MSKRYIGKNINMFLIVIIVISTMSLVAMSTYYNQRYTSISNHNKELADLYNNASRDLNSTLQDLIELQGTFEEKTTDVERYDELYSEKVGELENTQSELTKAKNDYERTRSELIAATNNLREEQNERRKAEQDLRICNDLKDEYKDERDKCEDELDDHKNP
jgi:chromosome segregation ATPase